MLSSNGTAKIKSMSKVVNILSLLMVLLLIFSMQACNISSNYEDGDEDYDNIPSDGDGEDLETDDDFDTEEEEEEESQTPYDTELLWLDEALEEDVARAGVIRTQEELITGLEARGELGDFKMYNKKIAVVISQNGKGKVFSSSGSAIIDAVRLEDNVQVHEDLLKEAFPIIGITPRFLPLDGGIREFVASEITLIHNGSDGRPAHIRATGTDGPLLFMTSLIETAKFPNPEIQVTVDYYLDADADFVRIFTSISLGEEAPENLKEVVRPGIGVLASDSMTQFFPDKEFIFPEDQTEADADNSMSQHLVNYFGFTNPNCSYGIADSKAKNTFAMLSKYKVALAMGPIDQVVTEDYIPEYEQLFFVGENSADKLYKQINGRSVTLEQEFALDKLVSVKGSMENHEKWADQTVEVLAVRTEEIPPAEEDGEPAFKYYTLNKTFLDENGNYEFSLVKGEYKILFSTYLNEYYESGTYIVGSDPLEGVDLPAPKEPHYVTFSVKEKIADTEVANFPLLAAKVDFFEGTIDVEMVNDKEKITYNLGKLLSTGYSTEQGIATAVIPLGVDSEKTFTVVASRGNLFTIDTISGETATPGGHSTYDLILEKVVDTSHVVNETNYYMHSLNLDMKSDSSLDSRISMDTKLKAANAAGYEVTIGTDNETVSDYTQLELDQRLDQSRYPMFWYPGIKVNPSWSSFTGAQITRPDESLNYYDISSVSFTSNGSYSGRRPVPGIWDDLHSSYAASLVQINTPRGASNSFFDYFATDEYPDGYDPAIGISSLKYEAKSTLNEWDTLELLNPNIEFIESFRILQDWFSLLEQGIYKPITASADIYAPDTPEHGRMGMARTMVISEFMNYSKHSAVDAVELAKKGQSIVTTGPIIQLDIEGVLPGNTVVAPEPVGTDRPTLQLHMKVMAPEWMPVYAAYVCVDGGSMDNTYGWYVSPVDGVVRYDKTFPVGPIRNDPADLESGFQDTYVVAIALTRSKRQDKSPVDPGRPLFAVSNPIFIEADGVSGFRTPLDISKVSPQSIPPYCMSLTLCDMFVAYDNGQNTDNIIDICKDLYCDDNPNQEFCQL